jgi:hypothetical protein
MSGHLGQELAIVAFAAGSFHLLGNLRYSVHSGNDRFSFRPRPAGPTNSADPVGRNVTHNIYHRHIVPLFLGADDPD